MGEDADEEAFYVVPGRRPPATSPAPRDEPVPEPEHRRFCAVGRCGGPRVVRRLIARTPDGRVMDSSDAWTGYVALVAAASTEILEDPQPGQVSRRHIGVVHLVAEAATEDRAPASFVWDGPYSAARALSEGWVDLASDGPNETAGFACAECAEAIRQPAAEIDPFLLEPLEDPDQANVDLDLDELLRHAAQGDVE